MPDQIYSWYSCINDTYVYQNVDLHLLVVFHGNNSRLLSISLFDLQNVSCPACIDDVIFDQF